MPTALTAERLRGIAAGAFLLTAFGGFWVFVALAEWKDRPAGCLALATAVAGGLGGLSVRRFVLAARAPSPDDREAARKGRRMGIVFAAIFSSEGGLIGLGAFLLARQGLPLWIPAMTALVVGLHFLPLAAVFDVPLYYWTGVAMCLCTVGSVFLVGPSTRLLVLGLSVGAVLWLTAARVLYQTRGC
jgi:hypothetical protein